MESAKPAKKSPDWIEWFWQGTTMSQYESELRLMGRAQRHALARARLAFEQASLLSSSSSGHPEAHEAELVLELYGETLYFSSLAKLQRKRGKSGVESPPQGLLEALREAEVRAPSQEDGLEPLLSKLDQGRPYLLSQERTEDAERTLRSLAQETLAQADRAARGRQEIWFQRLGRLGLPLALILLAGAIAFFAQVQADFVRQTTVPWRASSTHPDRGCQSPRQGCEQDHFFFHTNNDPSPWVEFDLRDQPTLSAIEIRNRTDCRGCSSRAVPLVVETSNDRETWHEVARRDRDFVTWAPRLKKTSAKWLRLRVAKRSYFHLKQVKITR